MVLRAKNIETSLKRGFKKAKQLVREFLSLYWHPNLGKFKNGATI